MTTDSIITIWHLNEDEESYKRQVFRAFVYKNIKAVSDKSGMKKDNTVKIRIPTQIDIPLSIGDYVRIGKHTDSPIRGKDFKIVEFADNRKGANPHWRIVAQ
ncbi:MAG: hypothetical protein K5664_03295 [Firmicutes bacterium]|nr:hypothetical protein [Bacillota bacterium]